MLHPIGILPGEPLDPARLQEEFINARVRATRPDQWVWVEQAITSAANLSTYTIQLESDETEAILDILDIGGVPPVPPTDPNNASVPYNAGFTGVASCAWSSDSPELIVVIATAQYWRERDGQGVWTGASFTVRAQLALEVDGTVLPGSGPVGQPTRNGARGAGLGDDTAAYFAIHATLVPPGPHTVRIVVGQAPSEEVVPAGSSAQSLKDILPTDGVYVASRGLFVIRVGMGALL